MSCPFYARYISMTPQLVEIFPTGGNRCALIISAHSPCWMQAEEQRAPDWGECPRNPEWVAMEEMSEEDGARFTRHRDRLVYLMHARRVGL